MSEVKLNLIDSHGILCGTIHGSIVDACVAALSAEPETIGELENALARYVKPNDHGPFASFRSASEVEAEPWDAGSVIIDLAARVVVAESSYSPPGPEGEVRYHDGSKSTDLAVLYRVSDEWAFLNSIAEYQSAHRDRKKRRSYPRLDARIVLYGRGLLEFVATNVRHSSLCLESIRKLRLLESNQDPRIEEAEVESDEKLQRESSNNEEEEISRALGDEVSAIHARWLMTTHADLEGQSPRDVLLAKKEFIDFDLHTRALQWSFQGEGPPCLSQDSFAYRFAGFGTHECVIYYDLVRFLLWSTLDHQSLEDNGPFDLEAEIKWLEQLKSEWLENPQNDFDGRIPAILIENERRRLPITLQAKDLIIDENCYACVMSAREVEMGYGPAFWHLDGSSMDEGFAFSFCRTREEWDEENRQREEFDKEFDRKWKEREARIARGEPVDDEFSERWIDSLEDEPARSASSEGDDDANLIQ